MLAIHNRGSFISSGGLALDLYRPVTFRRNLPFVGKVDHKDLIERAIDEAARGRHINSIPFYRKLDRVAAPRAHFEYQPASSSFDGERLAAALAPKSTATISNQLRTKTLECVD